MAKQDEWVRLTVRLPPDLYERLTSKTAQGGASMNAEIVARLQTSLDEEGRPGGELMALIRDDVSFMRDQFHRFLDLAAADKQDRQERVAAYKAAEATKSLPDPHTPEERDERLRILKAGVDALEGLDLTDDRFNVRYRELIAALQETNQSVDWMRPRRRNADGVN